MADGSEDRLTTIQAAYEREGFGRGSDVGFLLEQLSAVRRATLEEAAQAIEAAPHYGSSMIKAEKEYAARLVRGLAVEKENTAQ